jgi:hypothetical protein
MNVPPIPGPVRTSSPARPVALALLAVAVVAGAVWQLGVAWGIGLSLLAAYLVMTPRIVRVERLAELCFAHVADTIRAAEVNALRPVLRRQRFDLLRRDLDPDSLLARPAWDARPAKPGRYVTLKVAPTLWPRRPHVRAVTVRWLPPLVPDRVLFDRLRVEVAAFLEVDPAQVDQDAPDVRRRRVTYRRR